jgi:hypothetical protein
MDAGKQIEMIHECCDNYSYDKSVETVGSIVGIEAVIALAQCSICHLTESWRTERLLLTFGIDLFLSSAETFLLLDV